MKTNKIGGFLLSLLVFTLVASLSAHAVPSGPTVTLLGNSTATAVSAAKVNSTNDSRSPGGLIFTSVVDSRQQNTKWKAYVGNVTGTLALDDAAGNTIFQWSLTTITGEVYATRSASSINWSGINCSWHGENVSHSSNSTRIVEEIENFVMNHSNKEDNITATFSGTNHSQLVVGSVVIPKNACFTVTTWQKDSAQSFADSDEANFSQVILYDGTNNSVDRGNKALLGNVVYTTPIESNANDYRTGASTVDFQIILPENGAPGFASSTAYYFYVELS